MSEQISTIVYNSQLEWLLVRDNLYSIIYNYIIKIVVDDKIEHSQMIYYGLTERQRLFLMDVLEKEFFNISFNPEWAENTTFNLIYGIQGFFHGLIKTNKWVYLYKSLEPIDIANIIYENIKWQLDDDYHTPCLLENLPKYKCNKCDNIVEYLLINNNCDNCVNCIECN
jgi:hypothetical protein